MKALACGVGLVLALAAFAAPATADVFVIVDGPGAGVRLATQPASLDVPLGLNASISAEGSIGGIAGDHCGGQLHYHGTLFRRPDPDPPACGWGRVVPGVGAGSSAESQKLSSAIEDEFSARFELSFGHEAEHPPDYSEAAAAAARSAGALEDLISQVDDRLLKGTIPTETGNLIIGIVSAAILADQVAQDALSRLKNATGEPKDDLLAERRLRRGIQHKQRVLKLLRKKGLFP